MWVSIITTIVACGLAIAVFSYYQYKLFKQKQQRQIDKDQLRIADLAEDISVKQELLVNLSNELASTQTNFDQLQNELNDLSIKVLETEQQLQISQNTLSEVEEKHLAYIKERERAEKIKQQEDYYKLNISNIDLDDIKVLREMQNRFNRKESIDKLIWEVYIKPAYDILTGKLCGSTKKICGIYKITCLPTGAEYIGQSVDIRERWRQHLKAALAYGKSSNKLYQAMQEYGLQNFTFEIMEEIARGQLNERESYWINFYKTKEYGLNGTAGTKNS